MNGPSEKKGICLYNADIYTGFTHIPGGFILIEDGKVDNVYSHQRFASLADKESYELIDVSGRVIAPGLIDTHIHGINGFGAEEGTIEDIAGMAASLPAFGVTSFFPTIAPMSLSSTEKAIRSVVEAPRGAKSSRILGIHLEGPFISREKKGVQQESCIKDVDIDLLRHYWDVSEGSIISMTVAPELKGMRELVNEAQRLGITLLAGHTNATYEQMLEGIEAGILHATHFFNAMRSMHHRDPGVVGAILIHPELSCELIADGVHVHPALVEFLVKEKSAGKIVLVTDSLKPAGLPPGIYTAKGDEVTERGGVFCRIADGTIAGSSLTLNRGVANMLSYGVEAADALVMASLNPARVYGLERSYGSLLPGRTADLIIADDQMQIAASLIDGEFVYRDERLWNES